MDVVVSFNSRPESHLGELSSINDKFLVPYGRNPQFIGRTDLLCILNIMLNEKQSLQHSHRVALHGLGGVGKTQIALTYLYTYESSYDHIFWINAENEVKLKSGFEEIILKTGCTQRYWYDLGSTGKDCACMVQTTRKRMAFDYRQSR